MKVAYKYLYGDGVRQDYGFAKRVLEQASSLGDGEAKYMLGMMYYNGEGVDQDINKAKELWEVSAALGNIEGISNLGHLYYRGFKDEQGSVVVEVDYGKAKALFEEAAKSNDADSIFTLGRMYHKGQGVVSDTSKAAEFYEQAVKLGNTHAMVNLGFLYRRENGVGQDIEKAIALWINAAKLGETVAMHNLGDFYYYGNGGKKDLIKAREYLEKILITIDLESNNMFKSNNAGLIEWFSKETKISTSSAMLQLGDMYYNGEGGERNIEKAKALYELAARYGNAQAMLKLQDLWKYDLKTYLESYKEILNLLEVGVRSDNTAAIFNLGIIYYKSLGVDQDYNKARDLFEKASNLGKRSALVILGEMYYKGFGVEQNFKRAQELWQKAEQEIGLEDTIGVVKNINNQELNEACFVSFLQDIETECILFSQELDKEPMELLGVSNLVDELNL
jgi:hypothetical protein